VSFLFGNFFCFRFLAFSERFWKNLNFQEFTKFSEILKTFRIFRNLNSIFYFSGIWSSI
jgi:hypothetical protein